MTREDLKRAWKYLRGDGWPKGMDNRRANHDVGLIGLGVFTATMSDPKK